MGYNHYEKIQFSDCDIMISPIAQEIGFFRDGCSPYFIVESKIPFYRISDGRKMISSQLMKNELKEKIQSQCDTNYLITECSNGPAIKLKISNLVMDRSQALSTKGFTFDTDLVLALRCSEWPENTTWSSSFNTKWPTESDVERIKSYGCHFVSKSHPADEKFDWRISFSYAELKLSKLVPDAARKCFIGLKMIAKDYLSVACRKLKSYHLKMIFFNCMQTRDPALWRDDNIEESFDILLSKVLDCVQTKNCPNFWFPQINMFEDFEEIDLKKLSTKLVEIRKQPSKFIELD